MNNKSNTGFVVGTLVHTDKGLVPIQELKIGDRVLSKSETGDGELEYKPVVSTFKSPVKEKIYKVEYYNVTADERGEKGTNYIFCTDNHPFWVSRRAVANANADLTGEWLGAENIPAGYLTSAHGEEIELGDYAFMPVRTLPNFPDGCAYVQQVQEHDAEWNDTEGVEFVQFNTDGYQYISLLDEDENFYRKSKELALVASDAKVHLNHKENFKIDETLYKILNIRLAQDVTPYCRNVEDFIELSNSPLINDDGVQIRENSIGSQRIYQLVIDYLSSYGDATGLLEHSIHDQMQHYYDPAPNPYEDYVYNIEVAVHHTYFIGHDGIWVMDGVEG